MNQKKESNKFNDQSDTTNLDDIFKRTGQLKTEVQFTNFMRYVSKSRKYSIFNNGIVFVQNPSVTYYTTEKIWQREFNATIKDNATPMAILAPRTPILFVYDIKDTIGSIGAKSIVDFFEVEGKFDPILLENTIQECKENQILVEKKEMAKLEAGRVKRLLFQDSNYRNPMGPKVIIEINSAFDEKKFYTTLCHELAHIYLGHNGSDKNAKWICRMNMPQNQKEIEAEAVAYIVSNRIGLETKSEEYIKSQVKNNDDFEFVSVHYILKAARIIEKMQVRKKKSRPKEIIEN